MTYRIVVGVDGSEHSNKALRWALKEAQCHSGSVTAVLAWQVPFLSFPGAFDRDELEKAYKNFLIETVSGIAPTPAVPLETLVAEGDPTESLVEASKGANLLVLGTRGRSAFAGLLLGAVSQGAAATAHCPVVLIKVSDEE
jgi:nucleotide-binding universal stress UspA family protein